MELTELEARAGQAFIAYGLKDWTFGLARTKRRLGVCKYRTKRIEIAEYYARNSPDESVLDTLLHEIAHAIAGPRAGHGPVWKAIAQELGATPRACDSSDRAVMTPGDWQATCPSCNATAHLYRRPRSLTGYHCKCKARSALVFAFTGDPARRPEVPMTAVRAANWEARCVGCQTLHLRLRKPRAGVWRCKCIHRCELTWTARSSADTLTG